ncbi:MAG: hypothetical protein QOK11_3647 [Pseudonocardiales bacterium]|jgi:flavin reductase (DIM6/NTAB) family NADH-FMN oxidoreductase RutF|nr:hypothetical protein [Pseudonocardiales bacterium]
MTTSTDVQDSFRQVMASVCTPVSVATALDVARPHGTTVSAFASLSMQPPMVLVSLDRGSDLLEIIRRTGRFGLNVLGADHVALALSFARKGDDKFADVDWQLQEQVPRIVGVSGWLACRAATFVDGGDHIVVLGDVLFAESLPGPPLTYHQRAFGTHATHAGSTR